MYRILKKEQLNSQIVLMEVEAPRVAGAAKPGQFLIVRAGEDGERIPLTICDYNKGKGSVTIVTQIVGASSRRICYLNENDSFTDVVGPLGRPSDFMKEEVQSIAGKRYLFIAGGLGAAPVYPQAKYLKECGAAVDIVLGAKTAELLILEKELAAVSDNLYICTDDGTKGEKGMVTAMIDKLMAEGKKYDQAISVGPMIMMKFVSLTTKKYNLPLVVSLNTLMVDGTGMCGACRVSIGGKTKFACVDGPEFDAYLVDFDQAMRRQTMYKQKEVEEDHKCRIGLGTEK